MRKKVLIISQRTAEESTNAVIDWIRYYGEECIRLNGIDFLSNCILSISNSGKVYIGNIQWDEIGIVWFRRWISLGELEKVRLRTKEKDTDVLRAVSTMNQFMHAESVSILEYLFSEIKKKCPVFGSLAIREINKLIVLAEAVEVGLNIPETLIACNREYLSSMMVGKLITKPISNGVRIRLGGNSFGSYTSDVVENKLSSRFFPSKVQTKVDKLFEIRAFLLEERLYSMAIFSQKDKQTSVDFRKYNYTSPNRVAPFQLPSDIELKLIKLAQRLKLKTGSFDLIYTKKNEFVFLEVNPGGQFGMVSRPCNYYLEMRLAESLIARL